MIGILAGLLPLSLAAVPSDNGPQLSLAAVPSDNGPQLSPAAVPSDNGPALIRETLTNGMQVSILVDASQPLVATQLWYHVGTANESADNRGFAHLFEHLMFGGTKTHPKEEYAQLHHDAGGYENAYTSLDETVYVSLIVPAQHARVLELEADRMTSLALNEENLDNEKRIVIEELRLRSDNDPELRIFLAAQEAVLGDHPYAYSSQGFKEDVERASLAQARIFYKTYYQPRNAHLVIVGPVDGQAVLAQVRELFGKLPDRGERPAEVPPLLGHAYPREVIQLREDLPPVETAVLAFPLPVPGSADHWALEILAQLLGGSRVNPFEEDLVKTRRKAVYATSEWLNFRRGGVVVFAAAQLPYRRRATAFRFLDETLHTLGEFDWLSEEKVESAKRALRRRELERRYDANSQASAIGTAAWWQGDEMQAFESSAGLDAVSRGEVIRAWQRYIGEAEGIRVYLEPQKVPLYVRLFGWIYPLVTR